MRAYGSNKKCHHVTPGKLLEVCSTAILLAVLKDEVRRQQSSADDAVMAINYLTIAM